MIKIQYLICLQITRVFAEPLTETSAECLETTTRNNSIGPNGTFVDLSDMETEEMNTREQAAYAERKYLETLRAGELGTWEEDEGAEGSGRQQDDEGEVSEGSGSSKSSTSLDVFWKAERKLMDLVPIDGPARNDSRGVELPPPPSHVRVRRKKKVPSIVNTEAAILEDVFDEAAEDYYDEPQFKPITKKVSEVVKLARCRDLSSTGAALPCSIEREFQRPTHENIITTRFQNIVPPNCISLFFLLILKHFINTFQMI